MTEVILTEINIVVQNLNPELDMTVECPEEKMNDTQFNIMNCIYKTIDKIIIED